MIRSSPIPHSANISTGTQRGLGRGAGSPAWPACAGPGSPAARPSPVPWPSAGRPCRASSASSAAPAVGVVTSGAAGVLAGVSGAAACSSSDAAGASVGRRVRALGRIVGDLALHRIRHGGQDRRNPFGPHRARHLACAAVGARILVIDNYDSFVYNLVQYLGELGADARRAPRRRAHRSTTSRRSTPTAS